MSVSTEKNGPQSPDLNPIDHVWYMIRRQVRACVSATLTELLLVLQEEWELIEDQCSFRVGIYIAPHLGAI